MTEPSRPSPQPEMPSVVLTGPGADQTALLVIGLDTVVADLEPYTTLAFASTFGEARAFLEDSDPIDGHLESWLESRMTPEDDWDAGEQALLERYAGDSSPFDAVEYFGEQWDQWRPQAHLSCAFWFQRSAPHVFDEFARQDTGWGFDYEPAPWVGLDERVAIEAALTTAGYQVRHCKELADLYLDPRQDWRDVVEADSRG